MSFRNFVAAAGLALVTTQSASAQTVTFSIDNEYSDTIALEFYSTDRDHVWPGNDEVWLIGPSDGAISYPLECLSGELICFGAWTRDNSSFWGGGQNMSSDCEGCCAVCDGSRLDIIELN